MQLMFILDHNNVMGESDHRFTKSMGDM